MTITSWRMLKRFVADNLIPYGNAQLKDIARAVDDLTDTTDDYVNADLSSRVLLHDTGSITINGHTGTVAGITWGGLEATYSQVEFVILSSGALPHRMSQIVPTLDWVDNTMMQLYTDSANNLGVTDMDAAGNTFDLSEGGTTFNTGRLLIYGIV